MVWPNKPPNTLERTMCLFIILKSLFDGHSYSGLNILETLWLTPKHIYYLNLETSKEKEVYSSRTILKSQNFFTFKSIVKVGRTIWNTTSVSQNMSAKLLYYLDNFLQTK